MDEPEGKASALDNPKANSPSTSKDVTKPKRRSLVERELETNMTEKVTSLATNGDVKGNTSRYGRARRVKTDPEFSDTDKAVSGYLKSSASHRSGTPVYKMFASNSPTRKTEALTSNETSTVTLSPIPLNIEAQIESIKNKNLSLSRFNLQKKQSPGLKHNKGYATLDLSREMEKTASILKNMFSPTKSPYSSNSHLNNILERSSDKYSLEKDSQQNGYVDNSSVVKELDFDTGKKKKKSTPKDKDTKNNTDKKPKQNRLKTQPKRDQKKERYETTLEKECEKEETNITEPKMEDNKTVWPKKEDAPNTLSKSELFEIEAKSQYQVGDLAWSRVGTYPFWPCIITRDPFSETFVRKKMFGRIERDVLHVTFFGDNGRRGWIVDNMLRPFTGLAEFQASRDNFTREAKKKDPRLYAAFFVSEKKMEIWNKAVQEAESILRQPKRLRIDSLNDLLINTRIYKHTPRKTRGEVQTERVARTDSDVSLSESLYDTLFSEDDTKNDDPDRTGNRKKSLDVSDVVTACLDNIAVKTGISVIQKQSHMDIWLQKAKSKTPEKPQPKIVTPLKLVETKATSAKKSNKTPAKEIPKPYSLRRSGTAIRITRAQALNEHNYSKLSQIKDETGEDISSTDIDEDNKQTTDEDVPADTKASVCGIGIILKVETLCSETLEDSKMDDSDHRIPLAIEEEITDSDSIVVVSRLETVNGSPPKDEPTDMDVVDQNEFQTSAMEVETSELDEHFPAICEKNTEIQTEDISSNKNGTSEFTYNDLKMNDVEKYTMDVTVSGEMISEVMEKESMITCNERDENANDATEKSNLFIVQGFVSESKQIVNGHKEDKSYEEIKSMKKRTARKKYNVEKSTIVQPVQKQMNAHARKSARISRMFDFLEVSDKTQKEIRTSPIEKKSLTVNDIHNTYIDTKDDVKVRQDVKSSEIIVTQECKEDRKVSTDVKTTEINSMHESPGSKDRKFIPGIKTNDINSMQESPETSLIQQGLTSTDPDIQADSDAKNIEINEVVNATEAKDCINTTFKPVLVKSLRLRRTSRGKKPKNSVMQADDKTQDISEYINRSVLETLEVNVSLTTDSSTKAETVPVQDFVMEGTLDIPKNGNSGMKHIDMAILEQKLVMNNKMESVNKAFNPVVVLKCIHGSKKRSIKNNEIQKRSDKNTGNGCKDESMVLDEIPDKITSDLNKNDNATVQITVDRMPNIFETSNTESEFSDAQITEKRNISKLKHADIYGDNTTVLISNAKDADIPNLLIHKTEQRVCSSEYVLDECIAKATAKKLEEACINNTFKLPDCILEGVDEEKVEVIKSSAEHITSDSAHDLEIQKKESEKLAEDDIDVSAVNEPQVKPLQNGHDQDDVDSPITPTKATIDEAAMKIARSDVLQDVQEIVEKDVSNVGVKVESIVHSIEADVLSDKKKVSDVEYPTPTNLITKETSGKAARSAEIMASIPMDVDTDLKSDAVSIASSVDDNIPLAQIVRSNSKDEDEKSVKEEKELNYKPRRKPKGTAEADKTANKIKEVNRAMEEPKFIKYLEMRQDAMIDENPHVSADDVVRYLYKTWLYEQNLKSDLIKSDDVEQSNLVKGLGEESTAQPKKSRKKTEKKVKDPVKTEEIIPKDKSKRNIGKRSYYEDEDIEDELQIFEIFKTKSKTTQMPTEKAKAAEKYHKETAVMKSEPAKDLSEPVKDDSKDVQEKPTEDKLEDEAENIASEEEYDEAEFFLSELLQPKPNLFKGLVRERVCEICEKPGNLVKCNGLCAGMFHVECANKEVKATAVTQLTRGRKKKKPRGRKPKSLDDSGSLSDDKSHDVSEDTSMSIEESLDTNLVLDANTFEEGLALKMKQILDKAVTEYESPYSSDEELKWDKTIAGKCEIVDLKFKAKRPDMSQYANFKCKNCQSNDTPICFVCKSAVSPKNSTKIRQRCSLTHCHKYYHIECLDHWPQTQFNSGELSKNNKLTETSEALTCPRHVCHTCVSDDPRGCRTRFSGDKLARCVRCPATYHSFTKCLPAGSKILSSSHIVCPRHYDHRPGKVPCHVNTGWCFICALGGTLICCEYCPTSFHAECLNIKPPEGNYMCEECETGRLPLYGEMVWVKLGHYRWWPGLVLHPSEIPDNIMAVKHTHGEFVVRFFGQYDHYWVNRGRVFPFQEGDSGRISTQKSKIDEAFLKAMDHAKRACEILKDAVHNSEEDTDIASSLLPPHYVKLKVNKPCGPLLGWRPDDEENSITLCECDPNEPEPCGPQTQCLNRMLLTECGPTCRAGERCCNRAFERRLYPKLTAYRTPHRGWGLKTLEDIKQGEFVIEYVGELIDESEFRRRMQRMNEVRDENYYFLTLDKDRMIDAGPKGNLARFMNHCCEPNCETQKWTVLGDVRVGLFAKKDIAANQEVTFNYNLECNGIEKKACLCGARLCSGYIGAKPKQEEAQPKRGKPTEKRKYRKRKQEYSPSTSLIKPKPKPRTTIRSTKPRELTEIEKDLLIIKNATNGISSDSESSGIQSGLEKDDARKASSGIQSSLGKDDARKVSSCIQIGLDKDDALKATSGIRSGLNKDDAQKASSGKRSGLDKGDAWKASSGIQSGLDTDDAWKASSDIKSGLDKDDAREASSGIQSGLDKDDALKATSGIQSGLGKDDARKDSSGIQSGLNKDDARKASSGIQSGLNKDDALKASSGMQSGIDMDDALKASSGMQSGLDMDDALKASSGIQSGLDEDDTQKALKRKRRSFEGETSEDSTSLKKLKVDEANVEVGDL